jgi:hypothetical protein
MKKEFLLNLLVLLTIFSSGESYNKNRNDKNKILNILLQLYNDIEMEEYDEAPGNKKISKNF